MSTQAVETRATTIPDVYSSLEYLVAPIPMRRKTDKAAEGHEGPDAEQGSSIPRNQVNDSLQKLTNLAYILAEECRIDEQSRTVLTLLQAELAHLSVLVRKDGDARTVERPE